MGIEWIFSPDGVDVLGCVRGAHVRAWTRAGGEIAQVQVIFRRPRRISSSAVDRQSLRGLHGDSAVRKLHRDRREITYKSALVHGVSEELVLWK